MEVLLTRDVKSDTGIQAAHKSQPRVTFSVVNMTWIWH